MYTVDGIPKASARAFELLHKLETCELPFDGLPENPQHGAIGAVSPDCRHVTIALWNEREHAKDDQDWTVVVNAEEYDRATITRIEPHRGSAFETWQAMGEPRDCDEESLQKLWQASEPVIKDLVPGAELQIRPGTVALLELYR